MIRLLPSWHANAGKRLVKVPKLYIRDSGPFHTLHTIATFCADRVPSEARGLSCSNDLRARSYDAVVVVQTSVNDRPPPSVT